MNEMNNPPASHLNLWPSALGIEICS